MQTVPTLVGTGTAVAAAASGLVFGEPPNEHTSSLARRPSVDRSFSAPLAPSASVGLYTSPSGRRSGPSSSTPSPALESTPLYVGAHVLSSTRPPLSRHHRPASAQLASYRPSSRRQSWARQRDYSNQAIAENPRDSISSNSSWIRRLSVRPLSHHGSFQSSLDHDTTSIAFSHGSSAPILSPHSIVPQPLPPNKLVKRSSQHDDPDELERRRSRSHRPTLRRPATSHQRSATLHQFQPTPEFELTTTRGIHSFDQQERVEGYFSRRTSDAPASGPKGGSWTSFFHSRSVEIPAQGTLRKANDFGPSSRFGGFKRITIGIDDKRKVHLIKPRLISGTASNPFASSRLTADPTESYTEEFTEDADISVPSAETTPSKRAKRSISMTFSSAGNWVSRTSGSLRRPKRGAESRSGNKRHVSAPVSGLHFNADQDANPAEEPLSPTHVLQDQDAAPSSATNAQRSTRQRNSSSPLPSLARLTSAPLMDSPRIGSAGARNTVRPNQPSGSSSSSGAMSPRRGQPFDRRSTLDGSEGETRDFGSVDDDDTDFKSDGLFDSIRTAGSSRARAVDTPLDSMYDESPPSTAGNSKTKRLSIQEILGKAWDEENKIMEEDENAQTPVRNNRARFSTDTNDGASYSPRDQVRMSMDDDFDDDWARDDDAPFNSLSPPSKGGSLNARGINPNVRLALANISGNGTLDANINDTISERPLSNLFDWSEPSMHDKQDDGHSPRPRTAYAKQELDPRGGRSATRKGPMPTHVRSQSVPVVHDGTDDPRPTGAKYGTWGMSSKTVSEDWDEDFEFGGSTTGDEDPTQKDMFAVPESIRATQPSVKAHSGQIREFSLLVNDLKRLCRHGRDMGLLDGPYKSLWKEAEGIITLASPDEDSEESDKQSHVSLDFDSFDADERLLRDGMDAESLDKLDAAIDSHPAMSKTAVVRERPSPRRRSVFSPDDDIFGFNAASTENHPPAKSSRPRTPEPGPRKSPDVNGVVRHVMEAMQQRSATAQSPQYHTKSDRMHFDTNSLKALVKRAGDLRDILSDAIRKVDQITQSPARTPRHDRLDRHPESSPAFTKVFEEPTATPPRRTVKSRSNNGAMESPSPDNSPSSGINRRMQMMTVN
ncbi:hypothetical protein NLU13_7709 [Sarocladium strictum]|uniref:Uncharacterized protein n=1 Tax=Sarocladium strictum TaxID=5046 RepID=A0AA39L5T0_SARSR|nr:hypothetical protein NLU13_7709 [Sarocladium strictum]